MYALVDCNNFYASCERVFDPKLQDKPIVVLSNNDGCIISRSQEAKDLGIKMGEPYFQRKKWLAEQGVHVFSSNYALYGDMSRRVMEVLAMFTPELEVYSIDEAFLGLHGFERHHELEALAREMQQRVRQWVGIPVCVGIGPTKTLAKAANNLAKKQRQQTGGVWLIDRQNREQALAQMPVRDVWGVGRQNAARLEMAGVDTALALSRCSVEWARRQLGGVVGVRLVKELSGEPCLAMMPTQDKQNIACTRSFGKIITDLPQLQEAIAVYATQAAEKLRSQGSVAGAITVFAHTNRFRPVEQYFKERTLEFPVATDSTLELVQMAVAGIKQIFRPGIEYGKAGVVLTRLMPREGIQADLFVRSAALEHRGLMQALDKMNRLWGGNMVSVAATGQGQRQEWQMLSGLCSPRRTTHLQEVLGVRG
ncbi:Y-family DNA polymerase [Rufibacter quisquiliarum]|uniref:DNA polymerase V n=1 Tax=Rufibacter quisquiliarum TaxID=1549639 RepID=A0A839GPZ2_9BACT|nr:Y-family DNA polymerase [Rufibacter quisquiliarum]MBA9076967.1 DNA polymerase V [Rufibacter quisquiliarum]